MRIIIIGAVAAGTSAATKARRNCGDAEIIIFEKDSYISYSGCSMPYFIGGEIKSDDELIPRDPAYFKSEYNIDVFNNHEVLSINPNEKTLEVKNLSSGEVFIDNYDKLIIATGAVSLIPDIKNSQGHNVFNLRNINDMHMIKDFITTNSVGSVAIIGTGFIGLELCGNLKGLGMDVTLIERLPQVTPGLDEDMAIYVEEYLIKNGIKVIKGASANEIKANSVLLSSGESVDADMVIIAAGVRPNTELAKKCGIELGISGAIKVDKKMRTSHEDIYSCGDCCEQFHVVTGKPVYVPLGSTANKTGRIAGDSSTEGDLEFRGVLGTGIFKVFDMAVAQTGLSQREALKQGYDVVICHNSKYDKPQNMGGKKMIIKGVADKETGRLLGAQIVGYQGVDKRIDIFATAITFKANVSDLFHLDLAYAPPFSNAKDPVIYTGMILESEIKKSKLK